MCQNVISWCTGATNSAAFKYKTAQKKSSCRTLSLSGMRHYFKMDAEVGVGPPPDGVYRSGRVGSKEFRICTAGDERVSGEQRVMKPARRGCGDSSCTNDSWQASRGEVIYTSTAGIWMLRGDRRNKTALISQCWHRWAEDWIQALVEHQRKMPLIFQVFRQTSSSHKERTKLS